MPYKLLLADDSVTIQRVIELTFADEDVKVTAVGDGQQAIERIVADRPDIVLADVGMPKQDGYEVAAFVKGDPGLAHIPVLLLTGAFEPVDEERAKAVRCDGVLAKPFEPQLLIGRVKDLLKSAATGAPVEPDVAPAEAEPAPAPHAGVAGLSAVPDAFGIDVDEDATVKMVRPPIQPPDGDPGLDVESLGLRPEPTAPESNALDDYFDRLDAAFAHLTGGQAGREGAQARTAAGLWAPTAQAAPGWPQAGAAVGSSTVDELDPDRRPPIVFGPGPEAGASSSPAEDLEAVASGAAVLAAPAAPALAPMSVPEAFAAMLDAEREFGPGAVHQEPGGKGAAVLLPGTAVPSDVVDDVARRILERLGEAPFRDAIRDVVSSIAERLIREEIDRIKAAV
jgi:CheY-like chemotaxis protein